MSSVEQQADDVCASCGKVEVDDIKLKKCTACKLVKYCSVACQKDHWKQHKRACRKRTAEFRDDRLFKQPDESHYGECPICCLPLPLEVQKSRINLCQSNLHRVQSCHYETWGRTEARATMCILSRAVAKNEWRSPPEFDEKSRSEWSRGNVSNG